MPSTFSPNTGLEKPGDGEQAGFWGVTVNLNSDIIDRAMNGVASIALTGSTYTLTTSNGVLTEGQYSAVNFTGTPGATCTVTIAPNTVQKTYLFRNATNQTVILTQGSGGNTTLVAGRSAAVICTGTGAGAGVFDITGVATSIAGVTASNTELNYSVGVTSAIQTQLNAKQASDAGLTSIAGLTTLADRMIYTTASDTYAVTPLTSFARTLLDDADAATMRTTIGAQASDAGLTSIAGLTTLADRMIYTTASDTYAVTPLTSFARGLLDDADAATMRTTLGLVIGTNVQAQNANLQSLAGETLAQGDLLYATGANTLVRLPKGTAGQRLQMNTGATAPEWTSLPVPMTYSRQPAASGTTVDFTGLPANIRRITFTFYRVGISAGNMLMQLGTGGGPTWVTTGYTGNSGNRSSETDFAGLTGMRVFGAGHFARGIVTLQRQGATGLIWTASIVMGSQTTAPNFGGGSVILTEELTGVRFCLSGAGTFDEGGSAEIGAAWEF